MNRDLPLNGNRGKGIVALIDAEDYTFLMQWKWYINKRGYVYRNVTRTATREAFFLFLRHAIVGKRKGLVVDHIDQNKLNNSKDNLRFTNHAVNRINAKSWCASGHAGVYFNPDGRLPWRARTTFGGKKQELGYFKTAEEAAIVVQDFKDKYIRQVQQDISFCNYKQEARSFIRDGSTKVSV